MIHLKYIVKIEHYRYVYHSALITCVGVCVALAREGGRRRESSAARQLSPHRREVFCEGLFLVLKLSPHMGTWSCRYVTRASPARPRASCRRLRPARRDRSLDVTTRACLPLASTARPRALRSLAPHSTSYTTSDLQLRAH